MKIDVFTSRDFRNLIEQTIEPGPHFNVIYGPNGQGKTNFLEGIYSICSLRSFRSSWLRTTIALGKEEAYLGARVSTADTSRKFEVFIAPRSRKIRVDGKPARANSNYYRNFNIVLFCPEDLQVIRSTPKDRRTFLDRAVNQIVAEHSENQGDYEKVLKSRNRLLKDAIESQHLDLDQFAVHTDQLVQLGAQVIHHRLKYLQMIHSTFDSSFGKIFSPDVSASLGYRFPWHPNTPEFFATEQLLSLVEIENLLREGLKAHERSEKARGVTMVGPQRDDMLFTFCDQPANEFASQGQSRAIVLAFKTAECTLLEEKLARSPLFLLDDVSSELDPVRNRQLFEFLSTSQSQCFITTTHPDYVRIEKNRCNFRVLNGQFQREK